jgi:hypothetical protein
MISKRAGTFMLLAVTLALLVAYPFVPRIPQPQSYHNFADHRAWLGVPNFRDVASNLLFAIFGVWGLIFLASPASRPKFVDQRERWPYFFIFLGMLWTAFGSGYYHLAPNNERLVWDRLPMTVVFMPLVAAMIMERLDFAWGLRSMPILLAIGIVSVVQWNVSELRGAGDLRFYAAVQLYSVLAVLVLFFVPSRYTRGSEIGWVIVFYILAKIFETADRAIFQVGGVVSGHTLKHLAAGMAGFFLLRMLRTREPLEAQGRG